jgi:hypothetical protein
MKGARALRRVKPSTRCRGSWQSSRGRLGFRHRARARATPARDGGTTQHSLTGLPIDKGSRVNGYCCAGHGGLGSFGYRTGSVKGPGDRWFLAPSRACMAIMGERDVGLAGRGGAVSDLQFTAMAIASSFHASGSSVNCIVRRRHIISDGHAYKTLGNVTAGALAAMLLCSGAAVHAQAAPAPPPGNLPQIPNQPPVRQPTSNVVHERVQFICRQCADLWRPQRHGHT